MVRSRAAIPSARRSNVRRAAISAVASMSRLRDNSSGGTCWIHCRSVSRKQSRQLSPSGDGSADALRRDRHDDLPHGGIEHHCPEVLGVTALDGAKRVQAVVEQLDLDVRVANLAQHPHEFRGRVPHGDGLRTERRCRPAPQSGAITLSPAARRCRLLFRVHIIRGVEYRMSRPAPARDSTIRGGTVACAGCAQRRQGRRPRRMVARPTPPSRSPRRRSRELRRRPAARTRSTPPKAPSYAR